MSAVSGYSFEALLMNSGPAGKDAATGLPVDHYSVREVYSKLSVYVPFHSLTSSATSCSISTRVDRVSQANPPTSKG